ncbi:hypothetical protein [Pseudoxanthomonas putridarboris]|uniref:Addiction module component n=1 Tax=Pseudoxanthomonas putridarboris TaxID=752605 RepID=A0ABU9J397_9GAMM
MTQPTREEVILKLDRIDTALEAPDADRVAIMREARDWLAENPPKVAADALYYRERLQVIRGRHGVS